MGQTDGRKIQGDVLFVLGRWN